KYTRNVHPHATTFSNRICPQGAVLATTLRLSGERASGGSTHRTQFRRRCGVRGTFLRSFKGDRRRIRRIESGAAQARKFSADSVQSPLKNPRRSQPLKDKSF